MRTQLWVGLALIGACSWSDTYVDDGFTPEQWSTLQQQLAFPPPAPSPECSPCALAGFAANEEMQCGIAAHLADEMFHDPALSDASSVSCTTCHVALQGWIDPRVPDNVSLGPAAWTKRNAMTLWDLGYEAQLACERGIKPFAWDGNFATPGGVVDRAVTSAAMASTHQHIACLLGVPYVDCSASNMPPPNDTYLMLYSAAFGPPEGSVDQIFANVERAFTAYFATNEQFVTTPTPFDAYLAGNSSAISDSAKRGFAVFVGRGTCIECHSGPLFSDLQLHDTGVPQQGDHVPLSDIGNGSDSSSADDGMFITGKLREIANTGPYMHDGVFTTLSEVIAFYRAGGVATGYSGTKDPRIQPLDLTDQDAEDLEAFLQSLSQPSDSGSGSGHGSPPPDARVDAPVDAPAREPVDAPVMPDASACPPGLTDCGGMCIDTQTDPMNCGACGHVCAPPYAGCVMGTCQ